MPETTFLRSLSYDVDTYGWSVVLAYADWCLWQKIILQHDPRLASNLRTVSAMIAILMSIQETTGT